MLKCHCHWEPFDSIIATMQSTGCLFLSSTFGFRLRGKYCIFETKYWSVLKLDVSDSFSEFCLLELQYLLYLRLKFSSSNMVRCKSHINRENSHDFSEFCLSDFCQGKAKAVHRAKATEIMFNQLRILAYPFPCKNLKG